MLIHFCGLSIKKGSVHSLVIITHDILTYFFFSDTEIYKIKQEPTSCLCTRLSKPSSYIEVGYQYIYKARYYFIVFVSYFL